MPCHGLATPPGAFAELVPEIASLARRLAGEGAEESLRHCAELAAEAQVDLLRIRAARTRLLLAVEAALGAAGGRGLSFADADSGSTGSGALERLLRELASLERYERRAFSRRKRALRALSESFLKAD